MLEDMADQLIFKEALQGALDASSDGTYPVTLLTPGLGATAYYSESVIKEHAPKAFPKGTHVYLTHSREASGEPNPEKLLGTLIQDTTIRESDGAAVNRFKPVRRYAEFVEDVHEYVGLSISAGGTAYDGVIDGKQVKIAESIDYHIANSVDMVSYPGRAGSGFVESAFARYAEGVQPESSAPGTEKNGNKMETDEKLDKLIESMTGLAALVESALPKEKAPEVVDAEKAVADAVSATRIVESAEVPAAVKDRLIEGIKNGHYDVQAEIDEVVKLRESIEADVKAKFTESAAGAAGASGAGTTPTVIGWAS